MPSIRSASDIKIGSNSVSSLYIGAYQLWSLDSADLFAQGQSLVFHYVDGHYATKSLTDGSIDYSTTPEDLMTVQRASPKWVYDESGTLIEVPVDTLAIQHDPVTGESQGALIEESRTNLLLWSEDFTEAGWTLARCSAVPNAALAPDGTTTAKKLIPNTENSTHFVGQNTSLSANTQYNRSVYVKAAGLTEVSVRVFGGSWTESGSSAFLDLITGTLSGGGVEFAAVEALADGWFRISSPMTSDGTGTAGGMLIAPAANGALIFAGDGSSGIYVWGVQLEEGSQPSSYIPTEDAPVTRAADNVSRELGEGFNPREGTFVFDFSYWETGRQDGLLTIGSPQNFMRAYRISTGRTDFQIYKDGASVVSIIPHGRDEAYRKVALTYSPNRVASAQGGFYHEETPMGELPDLSGALAQFFRNSYVGAINNATKTNCLGIKYIPLALSEAELIELTS